MQKFSADQLTGKYIVSCGADFLHLLQCLCSPLVAKLAGETVQVVNIVSGSHDHLEGRDQLAARSAVSRRAEEPGRQADRGWSPSQVQRSREERAMAEPAKHSGHASLAARTEVKMPICH